MKCDETFVELQTFRGERNEYITAVGLKTNCSSVILFASRYEQTQKTKKWLQTRYYRLRWNAGNVPYNDMVCIIVEICSRFWVLCTKGLEKLDFLRQYHGNVRDLNDLFAPCARNSFVLQSYNAPFHNINNDAAHSAHYTTHYFTFPGDGRVTATPSYTIVSSFLQNRSLHFKLFSYPPFHHH